MMESDADRLSSIQALGGVCVRSSGGEFWAIFDHDFSLIDVGTGVESQTPVLTCRSCDVSKLSKEEVVRFDSRAYRVKRIQPESPAPGWSLVVLKV
jgi:hypothetical protein